MNLLITQIEALYFCKQTLVRYQIISIYSFVGQPPTTTYGKVRATDRDVSDTSLRCHHGKTMQHQYGGLTYKLTRTLMTNHESFQYNTHPLLVTPTKYPLTSIHHPKGVFFGRS
ncbi:hypothetical protein BDR04DRAFT_1104673 [Suillus decipiens]|nr:hypothetical protein BDR04DRAFT_1104673 [Suillus decipiens]